MTASLQSLPIPLIVDAAEPWLGGHDAEPSACATARDGSNRRKATPEAVVPVREHATVSVEAPVPEQFVNRFRGAHRECSFPEKFAFRPHHFRWSRRARRSERGHLHILAARAHMSHHDLQHATRFLCNFLCCPDVRKRPARASQPTRRYARGLASTAWGVVAHPDARARVEDVERPGPERGAGRRRALVLSARAARLQRGLRWRFEARRRRDERDREERAEGDAEEKSRAAPSTPATPLDEPVTASRPGHASMSEGGGHILGGGGPREVRPSGPADATGRAAPRGARVAWRRPRRK